MEEVKPWGDVSWSVGEDRKDVSDGCWEEGAWSGDALCDDAVEPGGIANPS